MQLPSKRTSIVLATCAAAIAIAITVTRPTKPAAPIVSAPAAGIPVLSVTVESPALHDMDNILQAHGEIAAWQEAVIGSETGGMRLERVFAAVGDKVRAGQVLATFAADAAQAEVAVAQAGLSEAKALSIEAANNARRARTLRSSGALAEQQVSQILTAEHTATARVESAQANLVAHQLRLKYTVLRAPDSGIVSARDATVGAVPAQGTELFRIIRQGRLEWRAEVPGSELGRLRPGMAAELTDSAGGRVAGRIRSIGATVDSASRNALVYVDLVQPATSGTLRPGIYVRGQFRLGAGKAMTVSQQAVVLRDGFSSVLKVGADNRVTQTRVTTGRVLGGRIEILEGLEAGARIVAQGGAFLNDGDLVRQDGARAATLAAGTVRP